MGQALLRVRRRAVARERCASHCVHARGDTSPPVSALIASWTSARGMCAPVAHCASEAEEVVPARCRSRASRRSPKAARVSPACRSSQRRSGVGGADGDMPAD